MMEAMIRLAAKRGISDRFHFPGFLKGDQVYEMLKSSDVYIMPSVSEPFGISPLEAMQVGVPTIISYPAMYEFLRDEGKKEVDEIKWEYAGQKVRDIYNRVCGR